MTSNSARSALGAGASLALRPTTVRSSYAGQGGALHPSDSGRDSSTEFYSPHGDGEGPGTGYPSVGTGAGESIKGPNGASGHSEDRGGSPSEGGNGAHTSPPQPRSLSPPTQWHRSQRYQSQPEGSSSLSSAAGRSSRSLGLRLPDNLRRVQPLLGATSVVPEHEAVEKVGDTRSPPESGDELSGGRRVGGPDLGWGNEQPLPPASGGGSGPTRGRWGSGHFYTVG